MPIPPVLHSLLTAHGPSGYESTPAAVFREAARAFTDDVHGDVMGSTIARVPGTGGGAALAIVGHIDEIGVIVTHIEDSGFLRFAGVGGWDPQILIGQRIELATKQGPISGVLGKKPIHLLKPDDRKKVPELKELHIDIGAADGDEARALVRVGDVGVIAGEPLELPNERVVSRSMDNRLGCFVALEAARRATSSPSRPCRRRRRSAARRRPPIRWSRRSRSSSTSRTRPTRRGSTSRRSASTTSARAR